VVNGDETLFDYLTDWFTNGPPPHDCVNDDYLIWMMDYNDCHCAEIQRWMVGNLESLNMNFNEVGENVAANRPWMRDGVQRALGDIWDMCFPDFDGDNADADYIRNLSPRESDICTDPADPDPTPAGPELCPDGITDPQDVMENYGSGIDNILWHWFY